EIPHLVDPFVAAEKPRRRQTQPFVENGPRVGVVTGYAGAAEIGVMAFIDDPEGEFSAIEHGLQHRQIGNVRIADVRIVEQKQIAFAGIPVPRSDGIHRAWQRAEQHGNIGRLRDQPVSRVEDRGDEVARFAEDRRARSPKHRLAHLAGDICEFRRDHRSDDRVEFDSGFSLRRLHYRPSANLKLPPPSSCARQYGWTTTAVSGYSTTHGPWRRAPAPSVAPSYTGAAANFPAKNTFRVSLKDFFTPPSLPIRIRAGFFVPAVECRRTLTSSTSPAGSA